MLEIKETTFELVGKDAWGNKVGTVVVSPYRLHTRRYHGVLEAEYRQWVASGYAEHLTPSHMTSFKTWRQQESAS
jgi:hypothetical protein